MKNLSHLSEQEKLDLFQVEDLEPRLELWTTPPKENTGCTGDSACNPSCVNHICEPPVGNKVCPAGGS